MNIGAYYEGDNGFVFIHAIFAYSLLILALSLNMLIFLLVKFSKKIDAFRKVFYTYCITNTAFAVNYAIILTQWVQLPGVSVFFPTGPFANDQLITPIAFRSESFIYFFIMCLVSATFVYRYFVVTRPHTNELIVKALVSLAFTPVVLWLIDSSLTSIPTAELRKQLNIDFGERFALDFEQIYILVITTRTTDRNAISIFGGFCSAIQLGSMIWTGIRIYRTIQDSIGSEKLKIAEKNAFRLLISQAINPMIMIFIPTFINFFEAETLKMPDIVNKITTILMNLFPVTNPMLNIIFSRDLSNSLKNRLSQRKKSSITIQHRMSVV